MPAAGWSVDGQVNERARLMRAKWGLSVVLGLIPFLLAGTGQALSQSVQVQICNQTNTTAYVAVTGHPSDGDARFLISGWYIIDAGACGNAAQVGAGYYYLYAESDQGDVTWSGTDARFCITYPGPFNRYISDSYNCSSDLLKGFKAFRSNGGLATVNLN
jgi:uncharacterized membrane protein